MIPSTTEKFKKTAEQYHCIGTFQCLGATHRKQVLIIYPQHSGTVYFNYKSYYSIVLEGVVDAAYTFTIIDVSGYGKQSDEGRFCSSSMFNVMRYKSRNILPNKCLPSTNTSLPFGFTGDEAYPLFENLLNHIVMKILIQMLPSLTL